MKVTEIGNFKHSLLGNGVMIVAKVLITIAVKSLTQGILDASVIPGMETANELIDNAVKNLPAIMSSPMLSSVPDVATNLKMLELGLANLDQSIAKLDAGEIKKYELRNTDDWVTIFAPIKPMIKSFLESKDPARMGVQPCRDRFGKSLWLCKSHAALVANQFDPAGGSALGDSIEFSRSQIGASIQSGLNLNVFSEDQPKIEENESAAIVSKNIVLDTLPSLKEIGPHANSNVVPVSRLGPGDVKDPKSAESETPSPPIIAKIHVANRENASIATPPSQKPISQPDAVSISIPVPLELASNHTDAASVHVMKFKPSLPLTNPRSQIASKAKPPPPFQKSFDQGKTNGIKQSYTVCGRSMSAKVLSLVVFIAMSFIGGTVAGVVIANSKTETSLSSNTAGSSGTSCSAGYYSSSGSSSCTACPAGKYSSFAGSSSCASCSAGYYSSSGSSSCASCSAGYYSTSGSSTCSACGSGYYSSYFGSSGCDACSTGYYSSYGSSSCTMCPPGQSSNIGSSGCTTIGYVSTIAGDGSSGSNDGQGVSASIWAPRGIALNSNGDLYVSDQGNHKIRKISTSGYVSTVAGTGVQGFNNGPGDSAMFYYPHGATLDSSGNLYIADTYNNKIRKITSTGFVSTVAGSGLQGSSDGQGVSASFYYPAGIAIDSSGNLYIADTFNHKIRKISSSGMVTTVAGSGSIGSSDGQGVSASFYYPYGITMDTIGNLYIADTFNHKIRKISSSGMVTTVAGSGSIGSVDGQGVSASFQQPHGIILDSIGNFYVADTFNNKIRKITSTGFVSTVAGSGLQGASDGKWSTASFYLPFGMALDSDGSMYVTDAWNNRIRKIFKITLV